MADKTEEHIDADHSGHPYRMPSVEECLAAPRRRSPPETGIGTELPDGRQVMLCGKDGWFVQGRDGWPDLDQPVDIHKEFYGEPSPDGELSQP